MQHPREQFQLSHRSKENVEPSRMRAARLIAEISFHSPRSHLASPDVAWHVSSYGALARLNLTHGAPSFLCFFIILEYHHHASPNYHSSCCYGQPGPAPAVLLCSRSSYGRGRHRRAQVGRRRQLWVRGPSIPCIPHRVCAIRWGRGYRLY